MLGTIPYFISAISNRLDLKTTPHIKRSGISVLPDAGLMPGSSEARRHVYSVIVIYLLYIIRESHFKALTGFPGVCCKIGKK